MKKRSLVLFSMFLSMVAMATAANAAQLATLLGSPDRTQPFVSGILEGEVQLDGVEYERDWTTQIYSILSSEHVRAAIAIDIIDPEGSTSMDLALTGLAVAAAKAPIVLTAIGGDSEANNRICAEMAKHPETAFVFAAGKTGYPIDDRAEPACMARNLLRVTALGKDGRGLMHSANYGATVRIAARGEEIVTVGAGGKSALLTGTSPATALVAGRLAVYLKTETWRTGAELIKMFLEGNTVVLPSLAGKVEGARALK